MTDRLRVLIEVNGEAIADHDIIVESARVNFGNGIREKPATGLNKEWELSGEHTITIDYREILAPEATEGETK